MIYLDNAATSLQKPKEVEEAVIRAFHTMGNPGRGAHPIQYVHEDDAPT